MRRVDLVTAGRSRSVRCRGSFPGQQGDASGELKQNSRLEPKENAVADGDGSPIGRNHRAAPACATHQNPWQHRTVALGLAVVPPIRLCGATAVAGLLGF